MNDLFEFYLKSEFQKREIIDYERGFAQGFQRGEKSGFQKGEAKKAREIAVRLKNMGMNVAFIAKALKISEVQVDAWLNDELASVETSVGEPVP